MSASPRPLAPAPAQSRAERPAQRVVPAQAPTAQIARSQDAVPKRMSDAVPRSRKPSNVPSKELTLPPYVPPIERTPFGSTANGNLDLAPNKPISPSLRPSDGTITTPADVPQRFQPGVKLPGWGCRSVDVTPEIGTYPGDKGITGGRIDWGCTFR